MRGARVAHSHHAISAALADSSGARSAWCDCESSMAPVAPDARAIFNEPGGATTTADLGAALGSTGILRVQPEHFFAISLASTWIVTEVAGSSEFDLEWRFTDFARLSSMNTVPSDPAQHQKRLAETILCTAASSS